MNLLLPHGFKKIGVVMAPLGFSIWLLMQYGMVTRFLVWIFGSGDLSTNLPPYYYAKALIGIVSFFAFLTGIYFLTFSKEKVEDEMIQQARLESFQFAALAQIIFIIIGFSTMMIYKEPRDGGLMLFFIAALFTFWLCFIGRLNYVLHVQLKYSNEELH